MPNLDTNKLVVSQSQQRFFSSPLKISRGVSCRGAINARMMFQKGHSNREMSLSANVLFKVQTWQQTSVSGEKSWTSLLCAEGCHNAKHAQGTTVGETK